MYLTFPQGSAVPPVVGYVIAAAIGFISIKRSRISIKMGLRLSIDYVKLKKLLKKSTLYAAAKPFFFERIEPIITTTSLNQFGNKIKLQL